MNDQDQAYAKRHAHAYIAVHLGDDAGADYAAWYEDQFIAYADTLADLPAHSNVWNSWFDDYRELGDGYVEVENLTLQR